MKSFLCHERLVILPILYKAFSPNNVTVAPPPIRGEYDGIGEELAKEGLTKGQIIVILLTILAVILSIGFGICCCCLRQAEGWTRDDNQHPSVITSNIYPTHTDYDQQGTMHMEQLELPNFYQQPDVPTTAYPPPIVQSHWRNGY